MTLDPHACYRALVARDARFDGRFFTGVVTTGVYCRPICPARTPLRKNVRFFASAAAAADAGFRPCRRCRPEASPGTPAWLGTSATVARALSLIAQGALDTGDVDALAARLGLGSRHLRRLFLEHVGASPIAIALTRRAHFAKRLIDETRLPMTVVAGSSGFSSVRRFNDALLRTYGRSPRRLRTDALRGQGARAAAGDAIDLRLPFRAPLAWESLLEFLALRAIPGVESVRDGAYARTIALEGFVGTIRVRPDPDGEPFLLLTVPAAASKALLRIVDRVRRVFDLDADPREIETLLARDPLLARLLRRRPGMRVPGAWNGFELAIRAILGQQVSVRGATTLAGRLVRLCGAPLPDGGQDSLTHLFPKPEALAAADLTRIGVPGARQRALSALARAVRDEQIELDGASIEDLTRRLTALPGVGSWTASYIAMRALREPDAFPVGDLGLRRAFARGGKPATPRALEARADAWRPWRAYAAVTVWAAGPHEIDVRGRRREHGARAHQA